MRLRPRQKTFVERSLAALATRGNTLSVASTGFGKTLNAAVDLALTTDNAARTPRDYLGGSRLGHACERALQFEFAHALKDDGQDFSGQLLRIFAIGHALEDLAVTWLRSAGLILYTRKGNCPDGGQFGFSIAGGRIRGHVDGIIAAGPKGFGLAIPALWECKTMNAKNWRACVNDGVTKSKPVNAAQIAVYQAYMDTTIPGIAAAPAVSTAINKDITEMHHELVHFDADLAQRMSDRGVRIISCARADKSFAMKASSDLRLRVSACTRSDSAGLSCWENFTYSRTWFLGEYSRPSGRYTASFPIVPQSQSIPRPGCVGG